MGYVNQFKSSVLAITALVLVVASIFGFSLVLNAAQPEREPSLAELALKADDLAGLPGVSDSVLRKSGPTSADDVSQPLNTKNDLGSLTIAREFLFEYEEAYAVEAGAWDGQYAAYIGNYLYRYPDPTQAQGIADQVIDAILRYPEGHLIGLETQDGPISGRTAMFIGSEGDAIYWFVGTQDNVLILLTVNGPSTSSTEELFKALVTRALR